MTKNICRRILKKNQKCLSTLSEKVFLHLLPVAHNPCAEKNWEKHRLLKQNAIDIWIGIQRNFLWTRYAEANLSHLNCFQPEMNPTRCYIRKFEEVSALQIPTKCSKTAPIYQLLEWSKFDQFFSIRKNLNKMRTNRMYKNVTEMLQESVSSMLSSRVTVVKLNSKEASLDILCCIVLYLPNRITGSPKSYFIYKGQNALGISHEFFIQFNFQLSFISFRFVSFHLHANIHMWRYIEL